MKHTGWLGDLSNPTHSRRTPQGTHQVFRNLSPITLARLAPINQSKLLSHQQKLRWKLTSLGRKVINASGVMRNGILAINYTVK
jgi:hypothetical protein